MNGTFFLETERLILREWRLSDEDREAFHYIMSNEQGREFYPSRLSREQSDQALERICETSKRDNLIWRAACLKQTGKPIGFTGLNKVPYETPFTPCVETGWQYMPEFWGRGFASEAAQELLRYGFTEQNLTEIVAFAVVDNVGSINVMKRIGMIEDVAGAFDHPKVPDSHPHLKRLVLYRLTREQWEQNAST